jgi:ubiquitin-large subunit ribosomal protein L40e
MKRTRTSAAEAEPDFSQGNAPVLDLSSPLHKQLLTICFRTATELHHDPMDAIEAAQEVLLCLYCKSAGPMGLSMPPVLDQFWHELILETEFYAKLCASIGTGQFIHHSKNMASDPEEIKAIRVTAMKEAVASIAGATHVFSPVFWPAKVSDKRLALVPGRSRNDLELFVKGLNGRTVTVRVPPTATVMDVKTALFRADNVPVDEQRLIYGGRSLEDETTLYSHGVQDETTLHLVRRLRGC